MAVAVKTEPVPQHMRALAKANATRLARADLKRQVKDGRSAAEVIRECPWEAATMTVYDLLVEQPRWGRRRTLRFLSRVPLTEVKTLGAMTVRQREVAADLLGSPCLTPRAPEDWL